MVKKILMVMAVFSLIPVQGMATPVDAELYELENILDMEAEQLMSPAGNDVGAVHLASNSDGADFAIGIIGAIGELALRKARGDRDYRRGRPGRGGPGYDRGRGRRGGDHPGFGRHYRMVKCVARNSNGRRFVADGYVEGRVARRALRACHQMTRRPWVKRSCHVVRCRPVRW